MSTPRPTAHYGCPHPAISAENRPIFGQNGRFLANFQLFLAKFSVKMSFLTRPHSWPHPGRPLTMAAPSCHFDRNLANFRLILADFWPNLPKKCVFWPVHIHGHTLADRPLVFIHRPGDATWSSEVKLSSEALKWSQVLKFRSEVKFWSSEVKPNWVEVKNLLNSVNFGRSGATRK